MRAGSAAARRAPSRRCVCGELPAGGLGAGAFRWCHCLRVDAHCMQAAGERNAVITFVTVPVTEPEDRE